MPDCMPAAKVEHETDGHKRVAQQGGQKGRADNCMEVFTVENIHQRRAGKTAGCQGNAGCNVKPDPQAERILIRKIGRGAKSGDQAPGAEAKPASISAAISRVPRVKKGYVFSGACFIDLNRLRSVGS